MTEQTVLRVGSGQQFTTIAAAIAAANQMGGNADIQVSAGVYVNDGGALNAGVNNVTVEGVGGLARLVDPDFVADGGAAIVTAGEDITLKSLDISDVTTPDGTGAGVRSLTGSSLTLDHVRLHNNQIGLAAADYWNGAITVHDSEIDHNGTGDNQTGNLEIGVIRILTVTNSYVHDAYGGSEIQSSADHTVINQNRIFDNSSNSSYSVDLPVGGSLQLVGNVIEQGSNSSSSTIVSWGDHQHGGPYKDVEISQNVVVNDQSPAVATFFAARGTPNVIGMDNNKTWNVGNIGAGVPSSMFQSLTARPTLDSTSEFVPLQPTISYITGVPYTGVRLTGTSKAGSTVTITDTAGGHTTVLGTSTASATGSWSFMSTSGLGHIDLSTVHHYSVNAEDAAGNTGSMQGALFLTDTGNDTLSGSSGAQDVFAIMSSLGTDIINGFQTATQVGAVHDVIDFSGRGLTSFSQLQGIMSGTTDTVFTLTGGKTVTLAGVDSSALTAADFRFS